MRDDRSAPRCASNQLQSMSLRIGMRPFPQRRGDELAEAAAQNLPAWPSWVRRQRVTISWHGHDTSEPPRQLPCTCAMVSRRNGKCAAPRPTGCSVGLSRRGGRIGPNQKIEIEARNVDRFQRLGDDDLRSRSGANDVQGLEKGRYQGARQQLACRPAQEISANLGLRSSSGEFGPLLENAPGLDICGTSRA